MLHKLLAGHRSHIRSILSIMLCLALVCGTVASMSVFAAEPETEIELATETAVTVSETAEEATAEEATEAQTSSEVQTTESTENTSETTAEAVTETVTETSTENVTEKATEEVVEATTNDTAREEGTETTTESEVKTSVANESETGNESATSNSSSDMPAVTLTGNADGVDVTVSAPEGAFAENVSVVVSAVDVNAFEAAVLEDCEALGDSYTIYDSAAVEISFYDSDNNKIQPATDVEVTLSGLDLATVNEDGKAEYALIYHMDDNGNVECIDDQNPGQESYTFTASSFSTYGVVNVSVDYGVSLATTYSDDYSIVVGNSQTISEGSGRDNLEIASYTVNVTEGDDDGITVTTRGGGGPDNDTITSLTVTGVTEGTVATITVNYTNGDTGTYTVTVTGYTVDHIDIGITVTATLVINGETITETVTLSESDFTSDTVTLTAEYSDGTPCTNFTMDLTDLESSTGSDGTSQVRVGGTYPIGTEDNPVNYTFTLTKDVTFTAADGTQYTVTMTFTATFSYWDDDNNCPGLGNNWSEHKTYNSQAGMDFVLTSSTANRSIIQIYKYVYDENGDLITGDDVNGKTYSFTIYDSSGSAVETATVTVGSGGIGYYSTDITAGTYYLVETDYASAVGDRNYDKTDTSATYTPSSGDASTSTSSSTTTATMTVNSSGTTIYTINNYYAPSTTSITVEKKVTGNMGDTTKKFSFTLTDSDGNTLSSFTLADGESQTIEGLTIGDTVYLAETDNNGYTVTVTDSEGNPISESDGKYAITVGSGVSITVTNDKDVNPDTGIHLDTAPYITILFGVILLGTVVLIRRRMRLF